MIESVGRHWPLEAPTVTRPDRTGSIEPLAPADAHADGDTDKVETDEKESGNA